MKNLTKYEKNYPVNVGSKFIEEAIARYLSNEPKREINFFAKRTVTTIVRMRVYNHCTFYLGDREEED